MKIRIINILAILLTASVAFSQNASELIQGKVTFVTSKSVYVKFDNTEHIEIGDSLQMSKGAVMTSCLSVIQKSSTSCVCVVINDCELKKEDVVFFKYIPKEEEPISIAALIEESEAANQAETTAETAQNKPLFKERIKGRISAASYSSFSGDRGDRHRVMYRFSLNAAHIKNSKFSFESYLNYRENFLPSTESNTEQQTQFFRVYNLAVRYDVDSTLSLLVGRKINNKASSLGAIDGLQGEKFFGNNYVGLIAGFRPDIREFGFNPDLFQYGAYFGRKLNTKKIYAQTTVGLLEQRNRGAIDRRYVYFQHSSTFNRKINMFASLELDTYSTYHEGLKKGPRLTNLYVSARYKFNRRLNVSVSYDSRKRIVFYETFKTEIERLLADDEARQGLRFRVNLRPAKFVNVGASYSKRFQNSQQNKSDNINAFASLSKIPSIGGRLSVNYNMNTSGYVKSNIISIRHSRSLIKKKLNADFYFRMADYHYLQSEIDTKLSYYGTTLSYRINRKLLFSILGEMATRPTGETYRVNAKIVQRFDKKTK